MPLPLSRAALVRQGAAVTVPPNADDTVDRLEALIKPNTLYPWQRELLKQLLDHPEDELAILPPRRSGV